MITIKIILLFLGFSSKLILSQSVILGVSKVNLGDTEEKIENSFSHPFSIKKNETIFSIYQDNQIIGYITFDKDTVISISKIWANKDMNRSNKDWFDALFNLLNQNKMDLFNVVIQLQNIREPNIDYQSILIDITKFKRIIIDRDKIEEIISYE